MYTLFRVLAALAWLSLSASSFAANAPPGKAPPQSQPYQMRSSVLSAAGSSSSSDQHRQSGSLSQSTLIGIGQDGSSTLYAGFWGLWAGHIIYSDVPRPGDLSDVLFPNYPNPFNPLTRIEFNLTTRTPVVLEVFDLRGARIRSLLSEIRFPGRHQVVWDGRDDIGRPVESGVYFYRLKAGGYESTMKMLLIK